MKRQFCWWLIGDLSFRLRLFFFGGGVFFCGEVN